MMLLCLVPLNTSVSYITGHEFIEIHVPRHGPVNNQFKWIWEGKLACVSVGHRILYLQ